MIEKPIRLLLGALSMLAALAVSQPAAIADDQVTLTLVAPPSSTSYPYGNNNNAGGIYVSPYYFSVLDGSTTSIQALICDDFNDEITQGESWNANVLTGAAIPPASGLTGTTQQYEEIGYLADQLFQLPSTANGITDTTDQDSLSFAIWDILNPASVNAVVESDLGGASATAYINYLADLTSAQSAAAGPNAAYYLNNLTVYQPIPGSWPAGDGTPQQFVSFSAPEALSPAILAFNLLALFGAVLLVRRRVLTNAAVLR